MHGNYIITSILCKYVHVIYRAVAPSPAGQAMAGPVLSSKTKILKIEANILRDVQTWGGH